MGWSARQAVMLEALAVALRGKSRALEPDQVHDLVTIAEQLLGSADPVARACLDFASQYELHRYDAGAVAAHAARLAAEIDKLAVPVPPGLDRRDIHG